MPTYSKIRAGHIAKTIGQNFEEIIHGRAQAAGISSIRIPDGCKRTRGPRGQNLIRVRSPFDYVLLYKGRAITLDAKTFDSDAMRYSDITRHQLITLGECSKNAHASGYLVWHRPSDEVVFYSAFTMSMLKPRTSLKRESGQPIGKALSMDLRLLFDAKLPETLDSNG